MIAHFAAAQLTQTQHGEATRLSGARPLGQIGNPEPFIQGRLLHERDLHKDRLGEIAQGAGRRLNRVLAENVADADAQNFLVLKTVQNRLGVRRALAQVGQLLA